VSKRSSTERHETLYQRMCSLQDAIDTALAALDNDDITTALHTLRAALYEAKPPMRAERRQANGTR
jgi:hypothetical protein